MTNAETARLMRLEVVALMTAVDDLEAGRYSAEERRSLASGLERLVTALRDEDHLVLDQPRPAVSNAQSGGRRFPRRVSRDNVRPPERS